MARVSAEELRAFLGAYVPEGESLDHAAYGVKQPNMLLMLPAFALAILPGVLLTQYLTRHYVIGTTDRSLVIARVKPAMLSMALRPDRAISHRVLPLASLRGGPATTKTGGLFTHIAFGEGDEAFRAKFHRAFSKENRAEAMAIGARIVAAAH